MSSKVVLSREELGDVFISSYSGSGSSCSTNCYCVGGKTIVIDVGQCNFSDMCEILSNTSVICKIFGGGKLRNFVQRYVINNIKLPIKNYCENF